MNTIRMPTPLRPYTGGLKEIEVEGNTVGMIMRDLISRYPTLKGHIFDEYENLRPYVNIFLNEEDVRFLQGEETPVDSEDRLMIVPSIAGG